MDALSQCKKFLVGGHHSDQQAASRFGVVWHCRNVGGVGNLVEYRYGTSGGHDAVPSISRSCVFNASGREPPRI